jgi:hypothetical protein
MMAPFVSLQAEICYTFIHKEGRDGTTSTAWVSEYIDVQSAVDGIYKKCVSMGADALMDFKIGESSRYYPGYSNSTTVFGVKISGIAIKRED